MQCRLQCRSWGRRLCRNGTCTWWPLQAWTTAPTCAGSWLELASKSWRQCLCGNVENNNGVVKQFTCRWLVKIKMFCSRNCKFNNTTFVSYHMLHQQTNTFPTTKSHTHTHTHTYTHTHTDKEREAIHRSIYIYKKLAKPVQRFVAYKHRPSSPAKLGAGIAQWLEHWTHDWKVAGSNPCWNGGRIFFSRVDFLCWLLFRYPFHPRVTAVARKKSRSFCQKCRWQVTAQHAYTLRMWILLNRASALVTTCP